MPDAVRIPTLRLLRWMLEAEARWRLSAFAALEALPGNPAGAGRRDLGNGALALRARVAPFAWCNAVTGLRAGLDAELASALAWAANGGTQPQVETVAGYEEPALVRMLVGLGFIKTGFEALAVGRVRRAEGPKDATGVTVEPASETERGAALAVYAAARQANDTGLVPDWLQRCLADRDWRLLLARCEGEAAGVALVHQGAPMAYCADIAVIPAWRRRGVQRVLLRACLAEAARNGADVMGTSAELLSQSHRNAGRAGLHVLAVRSVWTQL